MSFCCVFSGFATTIFYRSLFYYILRRMSRSFTYGEASIVIQGIVIFLANLSFKLLAILQKTTNCLENRDSISCELYSYKASSWTSNGNSEIEQLSTILQVIFQTPSFFEIKVLSHSFFRIPDRTLGRNVYRRCMLFC